MRQFQVQCADEITTKMRCFHVETTIVCIMLIIKCLYCAEFPASEFFNSINVIMDGSSQVGNYLCQKNKKPNCCSCSDDCYDDCCIDRYWNKSATYDLATYLEIFKEIQKDKITKQNLQCRQILSPLLKTETSKKILMKNCNLSKRDLSNVRVTYDHKTGRIYPHKSCVTNRLAKLSYPNIKAFCSHNVTNVSAGTVFSLDLRLKYKNCKFNVEEGYIRSCRHEVSDCDRQNPLYEMCQMYAAPVQNYKNPHCYFCRQKTRQSILLNGCRDFKDILFENPVVVDLMSLNEKEMIVNTVQYNFPLLDFYNKTSKDIQVGKQDRYLRCSLGKGSYIPGCCECSVDCFKTKSCCVDALWTMEYATMSSQTMKHYVQQLVNMSRHGKKHVCKSIEYKLEKNNPNTETKKKYNMVTNCPPESEYFELCTKEGDTKQEFDWNIVVPVVGVDDYLYKNIYCALCNSVYDFQPVNLSVICLDGKIQNNCTLDIHVENHRLNSIKECLFDSAMIGSCDKSHEYYDLCNSYLAPVNGYRNFHCLLCHSNTENLLKVKGDQCSIKRDVFTWFMLIRFKKNIHVKSIEDRSSETYCANKRFVDIRRVTSFQTASECWLEGIVEDPSIDNCLYQYKLHLFIILPLKSSLIEVILQDLKLENRTFHVYHQSNESISFKVNYRFGSVQVKAILRQYQNTSAQWKYNARLIFIQNPTPLISDLHAITFQNNFPLGQLCYRFITLDVDEAVFTPNCSAIYKSNLIDYHNLSIWISMTENKIERNVISCTRYYMIPNCTLHEERIITVFKNGSMKDEDGDLYQVNEYLPTRNGAAVCGLKEETSRSNNIEIWLTNALLPLSIIGYCLVIITYINFKTLQNLPGLCTIALTASLMIGDLMFLLNNLFNLSGINKIYFLCKTVAVLMHFFIIKAYFWTLMISYFIMKHFTKHVVINNNHNAKQKFFPLLLMSLLVSFGIITTAFLLDHLEIVLIGYGDNGTCVPHVFYGRVIFYIIPMFLFIFLSFGFLLRTVSYLVSERRRVNKSLEQSFIKRMSITLMFIKLALVLGINDIIGIVQLAYHSSTDSSIFDEVIGMIYSVLRCLRGVFLFLIYVCKEEVITLYKTYFCVKVSDDIMELDTRKNIFRRIQQSNTDSNTCESGVPESYELNVRRLSAHESNIIRQIEIEQ